MSVSQTAASDALPASDSNSFSTARTHVEKTYANGDTYSGEIEGTKKNGTGHYIFSIGGSYQGEWSDDKYDGQGTLAMVKNKDQPPTVYEGGFQRGKRSGHGKFTKPNGDVFEGAWDNGKQHGKGLLRCTNGNVYDGTWEQGQLEGDVGVTRNGVTQVIQFAKGKAIAGQQPSGEAPLHVEREANAALSAMFAASAASKVKAAQQRLHKINTNFDASPEAAASAESPGASPVLAYREETYSNGDIYKGEFHRRTKHGKGRYDFAVGGYYDGEWSRDTYDGAGIVVVVKDGQETVYEGQFVAGKRSGTGLLKKPNGDVFEGLFDNNKQHGEGRLKTAASGMTYAGTWVEGLLEGQVVATTADGKQAIVNFVKGKPERPADGPSALAMLLGNKRAPQSPPLELRDDDVTFPNGDRYVGKMLGKRQKHGGYGEYRFANGGHYKGEWMNDKYHGDGALTSIVTNAKGERKESAYEGRFMQGLRHGYGQLQKAGGDFYQGEWVMGNQEGKGTLIMMNGTTFDGEWKEGLLHGTVVVTKPGRRRGQEVIFREGIMLSGGDLEEAMRPRTSTPNGSPKLRLHSKEGRKVERTEDVARKRIQGNEDDIRGKILLQERKQRPKVPAHHHHQNAKSHSSSSSGHQKASGFHGHAAAHWHQNNTNQKQKEKEKEKEKEREQVAKEEEEKPGLFVAEFSPLSHNEERQRATVDALWNREFDRIHAVFHKETTKLTKSAEENAHSAEVAIFRARNDLSRSEAAARQLWQQREAKSRKETFETHKKHYHDIRKREVYLAQQALRNRAAISGSGSNTTAAASAPAAGASIPIDATTGGWAAQLLVRESGLRNVTSREEARERTRALENFAKATRKKQQQQQQARHDESNINSAVTIRNDGLWGDLYSPRTAAGASARRGSTRRPSQSTANAYRFFPKSPPRTADLAVSSSLQQQHQQSASHNLPNVPPLQERLLRSGDQDQSGANSGGSFRRGMFNANLNNRVNNNGVVDAGSPPSVPLGTSSSSYFVLPRAYATMVPRPPPGKARSTEELGDMSEEVKNLVRGTLFANHRVHSF